MSAQSEFGGSVADRGQTGLPGGEIAPDSQRKKIARGDSQAEGRLQEMR